MRRFFENTKPGGQLLALFLIFVIFFIIANGISVAAFLMGIQADSLGLQAFSQVVCFAGTALAFAFLFADKPVAFLQLAGNRRMALSLLGALLVMLSLVPLSDWLSNLNEGFHLPQRWAALEQSLRDIEDLSQRTVEGLLLRDGAGVFCLNILVLAILPALCEELLFRGALQQTLCRLFANQHAAVWVTAAIFSLFHLEFFAFLPRFVLGVALGYLFVYGKSIWINAFAHFVNNAAVVVMYAFVNAGKIDISVAESFNSPWYLALASLALAAFFFYIFFLHKSRNKKI